MCHNVWNLISSKQMSGFMLVSLEFFYISSVVEIGQGREQAERSTASHVWIIDTALMDIIIM